MHEPLDAREPIAAAWRAPVTGHVVIISVDGLRPDAVDEFRAPTIARLAREGSYSYSARTIMPSKTLPSHTSMLTGVTPLVHGITWNSDETASRGDVRVPTIFRLARATGLVTAAFFSKTKFRHLEVSGSLDYSQSPSDGSASWSAERTMRDLAHYLEIGRPNLLFVHVAEPDYAGHAAGWMSPSYFGAVHIADAAVARVMALADTAFGEGEYTLMLTADHGGHAKTHGSSHLNDVLIPWIAWGKGVRPSMRLSTPIRTMDTAASALWLLGVRVPEVWSGRPVVDAFVGLDGAAGRSQVADR